MRVLIVSTSERTGGAAVAANRLKDALNNNGVKAKMLVRDKTTDDITVVRIGGGWRSQWRFLWERWCIFVRLRFCRKRLFEIDIANTGHDITSLPEFKEADVVHLHWVNQGMLSLQDIRRILEAGKPLVWTMHDLWPATAICHYARGCQQFRRECHHCRLLPNGGSANDLSAKVWRRKNAVLKRRHVSFVACSRWLGNQAKESGLLSGHVVRSIPNPIDTRVFCPQDRQEARRQWKLPTDKRLILFVSQRVTDERKGMDYFVAAIAKMVEEHPEMKANTAVLVLGGHSEEVVERLALPVFPLGYVGDQQKIVSVYNAADVFVLPSLEDNLPNTIMESMACGVPCVGFKVGGIPEMIDHQKNGYVANYKSSDDLSRGIRWILDEADTATLSRSAVGKVVKEYSQQSVALRYTEVYNEAIALEHYKI
ncbi:MAG: glycosyltransferase family 4 protein [Prevotella sp.]|nr:glycosyltransferase family 4 protein [Prevotella sp.]